MPNPLSKAFHIHTNDVLDMPQFFYLQDNWTQHFPFVFPAFQDVMFYYF